MPVRALRFGLWMALLFPIPSAGAAAESRAAGAPPQSAATPATSAAAPARDSVAARVDTVYLPAPASHRDTVYLPMPAAAAAGPAEHEHATKRPHAFVSDFVFPLISIPVPGLGLVCQGEWSGLGYTGVAAAGLLLAVQGISELDSAQLEDAEDLSVKDWSLRKVLLGLQTYQGAGFLSGYSAFRASVPGFRDWRGKYTVLSDNESLGDLLSAPARVGFLERPTTFIPMGLLAAFVGYLVYDERNGKKGSDWAFSWDDVPFSAGLSYNAGVSEEAAFRGYLLPVAYQYTGQNFWLANGLQAGVFGLAHYGPGNRLPWPQALLGFYFGYLSRRNQWTLSEGIFNHFWWDTLLFLGEFATTRRVPAADASFSIPF